MNVNGRIAIVTGAGSGIGKGIAGRLGRHGARTVVADINESAAAQAAAEICAQGGEAIPWACDVTARASAAGLVEAARARYGRIDILVNNVGVVRDNYLTKMPEEDWDFVLATNLKSYFLCSQAVAPHMMEQRYGRIVNISSRAWLGNSGQANYAAAKGGVISLTRVTALELAPFNVTANCVAPGLVDTPLYRNLRQDVQDKLRRAQPAPQVGTPEEVAYAVHAFAADEAWYMTGQTLYVCGGKSLGSFMGV